MKKFLSAFLAVILCCSLLFPATVTAAGFDSNKPHWKASAEVTGRKLTLTVQSVNCAGKLAGGDLCLKYDPDVLEFVKIVKKCQIGMSVPNGTYPIGDNGEGGTGIFANLANTENIEEDGILYVAEFEIIEGKTCGTTPFTPAHIMMTTVAEDGSLQSLVDETGNAAPVDFKCDHADKVTTTVLATCQADGKETVSCAACGEVMSEKTLPMGSHDFSVKVSETPATCTDAGKIVWKCSACDATKEEPIAALGHDWDNGVVTTEPTCVDKGVKTITCTRCNETKTEDVAALGHDYSEVERVAANCKEKTDGKIIERCVRCRRDEMKIVLKWEYSHSWDDGEITKSPTCVESGEKVFTCTICAVKKYEIIGTAEGHKFKTTIKEATCTTNGLKTDRCEICGYTTTTVLPSTGHDFETVTNVMPTHTEPGITAGKRCKNCGLSLAGGDTIPALRQSVRFYIAIEGINGADTAVNSGYVKVNICFDVLKDELDQNDLEAIAQIYGADLKLTYNNDYFKVTSVDDNSLFTNTTYTDMNTANTYGRIIISRDMDMNVKGKTFSKSGNVFATVTLQIDKNAPTALYNFELNPIYSGATVVASNYNVAAVCEGGSINVQKLGDANGDGYLSASDVLEMSNFLLTRDGSEYIAKLDLDKDGVITYNDLDLLRQAIVGNDEYLYLT